jgi:UDPglucose 6-dehydrogenase
MAAKPPIGVIGAGWVGLVTATCFAELGHEVVVREIVQSKVDALSRGELVMHEPGLQELLTKNIDHMTFTSDMGVLLDRTRLMFVCVDTPPTYSGDADLSRVETVVQEVGDSNDHALIMKSTVPVGTGAAIRRRKHDLAYVSCPEFLKEGTAIADFMQPDRVVVGADDGDWAGDAVEAIYKPLGGQIVRTDIASAEMIKLASNAFLATKISFINEIANVCEEVGADVTEVARGMGLDNRIGPKFLAAGIGYGGSCFPKDVTALKQLAGNSGYHFQLLNAVIEVNELQKRRVIGKLKKHLGDSLVHKKIALLGLSFKPHTDDMREASSLVLSARLAGEGADVSAYDPVAAERAGELLPGVDICDDPMAALAGADAAVVVTEWPQFAELDWPAVRSIMRTPLVIDGRNVLDAGRLRAAGFAYDGVGRPAAGVPANAAAAEAPAAAAAD